MQGSHLALTDRGKEIADHLLGIEGILGKSRSPHRPADGSDHH